MIHSLFLFYHIRNNRNFIISLERSKKIDVDFVRVFLRLADVASCWSILPSSPSKRWNFTRLQWRFCRSVDYTCYFYHMDGSVRSFPAEFASICSIVFLFDFSCRLISSSRYYNDKSERLSSWYSSFICTGFQEKWPYPFGYLHENLQTRWHCRCQSQLNASKNTDVSFAVLPRVMVPCKRVCHIDSIMVKPVVFSMSLDMPLVSSSTNVFGRWFEGIGGWHRCSLLSVIALLLNELTSELSTVKHSSSSPTKSSERIFFRS